MTTEGSELVRPRFTDGYSRPRPKLCRVCWDLPHARALPTCSGCGRASTATQQISGGPLPKPEGRAARAGSVDLQSHAPKDPAADSARSKLPTRDGEAGKSEARAAVDPSRQIAGVGSGGLGCISPPSAAVPRDTAHALPEPIWYVPPPAEAVVVVETTAAPVQRLRAPLPGPRTVILPARYIEAAEIVAAHYGFTLDDLRALNRTASLVRVRREAMRAVRELGASYPEIGAVFNRDHSSVMNMLRGKRQKPLVKVRIAIERAVEACGS